MLKVLLLYIVKVGAVKEVFETLLITILRCRACFMLMSVQFSSDNCTNVD